MFGALLGPLVGLGNSAASFGIGGLLAHKAKKDAENHAKNVVIAQLGTEIEVTNYLIPIAATAAALIVAILIVNKVRG